MSDKRAGHSHGSLSIDQYAYGSAMRSWNPSFKIITAAVFLVCVIAMDRLPVSLLVLFFMALTVMAGGRLSPLRYLRLMAVPLAFIILGSIAVAFDFSLSRGGDYCLFLGFFYISATGESLFEAGSLIVKAFSAVSCLYLITLTTPMGEIVGFFRKLHVPKLLVELMYMIYRFIFILYDSERKMTVAARSRLGYHSLKASWYSFGRIFSNLLVVSMRRAGVYYDALESRCYNGDLRFWEDKKPVRPLQVLWALALGALILALRLFVG